VIERALIEEMFARNRARGQWDMDGPLLWGYFFTCDTPEPLEAAAPALAAQGYDLVEIFATEDEGVPELFWLHVEKVETHSVDTLDQRNRELDAFAAKWGLASYDGMDVGAVPA
jgi:hypothetical protein